MSKMGVAYVQEKKRAATLISERQQPQKEFL